MSSSESVSAPDRNHDPAVWAGIRDRAEAMINERPDDPGRVDQAKHEVEVLLIEIADYLNVLNNDRYRKERAYSKRKNAAMAGYAKQGYQATIARAMAEVDAETEKAEWDALRAAYHYCEDTQKALQTKHYGLMNSNKNMQSVMFSRGR